MLLGERTRHLYVQQGPDGTDGIDGGSDAEGADQEPRSHPALSNATLVHSSPYGKESRTAVGLRLGTGTGLTARDLLVTQFRGGAIRAGSRTALLFEEGESGVESAILHKNGYRPGSGQVRGGIGAGVEFEDKDPKLRNVRYEANPDPRPKSGSPALKADDEAEPPAEGEEPAEEQYIGAFGTAENWLEEWTFFGPEADYDAQAAGGAEE